MFEVHSASPTETLALGRRLAALLRAGDVVLLSGRLGVGKTLFAVGIGEGLGVSGPIVSPTFMIVRIYDDGFLPFVHADVYRLGSMGEFDDLELPESARDGVLVIEWGDAVAQGIPENHLLVRIAVDHDASRRFSFLPHGTWKERSLEELQ